jgi:hypothetical protein
MLKDVEESGELCIVSFLPHGRAFTVLDEDRFLNEILPKYFKLSRWHSFTRQLGLYGFRRVSTAGSCGSAYYHELFLRGHKRLCLRMKRVGLPTKHSANSRRESQTMAHSDMAPHFYAMRSLP